MSMIFSFLERGVCSVLFLTSSSLSLFLSSEIFSFPSSERCWSAGYRNSTEAKSVLMCIPLARNADILRNEPSAVQAILDDLDHMFAPLSEYYSPPKSKTPATDAFPTDPVENVDYMIYDWKDSPYVLGAYTYPSIPTLEYPNGATRRDNARLDLQKPAANGRIFFAGEATHLTAPGTGERTTATRFPLASLTTYSPSS